MSDNRLHLETSPYLLQHKDNPVHWRAWSKAVLDEAKASGKPVLLSVGYAACHWCHVMAHESFEDAETAALMNELFVNIKVDREERPDIDAIYMGALHHLGQQGGWPLTMFLDSDGRPFWGGTYFPKMPRYGQPGFRDVLQQVAQVYQEQKDKVAHNAKALTDALSKIQTEQGPDLNDPMIEDLTARMVRAVDPDRGGINGAPKFPQWNFFWLLWRGGIRYQQPEAQRAVETTLHHICQGGIYDHLGGGFARYSVDEDWLAPHFEKMLYDNALLVDLMTEVWRETQAPLLKIRIAETVRWLLKDMIGEGGGFAASLDADSEGEEGKFYVWTKPEIEAVLGAGDAEFFSEWYDVSAEGNWEGKTILNRLKRMRLGDDETEARLETLRGKLLLARSKRVPPGWDDKIVTDWNGLMIAALARAARVFDQPSWLEAAQSAFAFISATLSEDDRLYHAYRAGKRTEAVTSSDYANMIWASLRLHEATLDPNYLAKAEAWAKRANDEFWMDGLGGFAMTPSGADDVIVRLRHAADDATPNANAVMLTNLMQLHLVTGNQDYLERADSLRAAFAADIGRNLIAHSGFVAASLSALAPQLIVIAAGSDRQQESSHSALLGQALDSLSMPGACEYVVDKTSGKGQTTPCLIGKNAIDGHDTAYCCIGPRCAPPVSTQDDFNQLLRQTRRA